MDKVFKNTLLVVLCGFIFGVLFFLIKMDVKNFISYNEIYYNTSKSTWTLFFSSFFTYNKYIVIIFLMLYIRFGFIVSYILLFIRNLTLGFTTTFFIISGKFYAILDILRIYFFQNIIFIFLLILLCILSYKSFARNKKGKRNTTKEILVIYFFVEIVIVAICFYESFFLKIFL